MINPLKMVMNHLDFMHDKIGQCQKWRERVNKNQHNFKPVLVSSEKCGISENCMEYRKQERKNNTVKSGRISR